MAIREIRYYVTANGISPSSMQRGGIQGEHNATKLVFVVSDELAEVLYKKSNRDKLVYRFEAHTGTLNTSLKIG